MKKIRIAIIGIGNCASSLIQGIHYYQGDELAEAIGLMHAEIGAYRPSDIEVVAAFDIDARKVGRDVSDAIFVVYESDTPMVPDDRKYDRCNTDNILLGQM